MSAPRYLLLAQLAIPPELEDAFNHLYDTEHIPPLMGLKGFYSARRYRLEWTDVDAFPEYLAIYEVDNPDLPRSTQWRALADAGEWAVRIRPHLRIRWHSMYQQLGEPFIAR